MMANINLLTYLLTYLLSTAASAQIGSIIAHLPPNQHFWEISILSLFSTHVSNYAACKVSTKSLQ